MEIKPCPFCNSNDVHSEIATTNIYNDKFYQCRCYSCGANGPSPIGSRSGAIEEWNKNHSIFEQQEIIDRQRNALQLLLNAIWIHINAPDDNGEQLQDAYRLVSSASTMTGTTEE